MESILDFLTSNKEWVFSGIGVALLSGFFSTIIGRVKQTSRAHKQRVVTRGNLHIQVGKDINISIGNNSDKDIIESLNARQKANKKNKLIN